jgi:flagellar hook-associated protein 3 FlgL
MRIAYNTVYRSLLESLERTAGELAARQQQVASGRRIATPSDDPSAAVRAIAERNEIGALDRYLRAADTADARLSVLDGVLGDISSLITSARRVVAAASNSFLTDTQREALATELEGIRDTLVGDANTRSGNTYLFAGTASLTRPYVQAPDGTVSAYQGDSGAAVIDVDRGSTVQVTFDGDAIFRGTDTDDVFVVLENVIAAVRAADAAGIAAGMDALNRAFDRVSAAAVQVGHDMRQIDGDRVALDRLRRAGIARVSDLEDANMVEAISGMTRAETAYRAALGAGATLGRLSLFDFVR